MERHKNVFKDFKQFYCIKICDKKMGYQAVNILLSKI